MKQRNSMAQRSGSCGLSRRTLLRAGFSIGGAVLATATWSRLSVADAKLPQNQVSYQSTPKGEKHCKACVNYEGNGTCRVVAGDISPDGWCRLWNAR